MERERSGCEPTGAACVGAVPDNAFFIVHQRRGCRLEALLDQVERVEASPELAIVGVEVELVEVSEPVGAAEQAAVEAERVGSCSTGRELPDRVEHGRTGGPWGSHRLIGGRSRG